MTHYSYNLRPRSAGLGTDCKSELSGVLAAAISPDAMSKVSVLQRVIDPLTRLRALGFRDDNIGSKNMEL
jgi:hypothetical protein